MVKVIGQQRNKQAIDKWERIPNFIIIEGSQGSGRKYLARYICERFEADLVVMENKVDDIRDIISDSQLLNFDRVYIVDGSSMSIGAKNTLLKVTEEPPANCHIVLTVNTMQQTLPTLVSRAQTLTMAPYTTEDYFEYLESSKHVEDTDMFNEYLKLINSFGMLHTLVRNDISLYYTKVTNFLDNIWNVTFANALNITDWLKLKKKDEEDEEKLDPILFVNCVLNMFHADCLLQQENSTWDILQQNKQFIQSTSKCLNYLNQKGRSKEITLNTWLEEVTSIG